METAANSDGRLATGKTTVTGDGRLATGQNGSDWRTVGTAISRDEINATKSDRNWRIASGDW
ncbi:MAG: hypothetical protein RRB24_09865 [Armatimonadota bacterium]|nr:hypothetical protein [Armatimonadota bacterium]